MLRFLSAALFCSLAMSAEIPVVERVDPAKVHPGEVLTIEGRHFGADQEDGPGMVWLGQCLAIKNAPGGAGWLRLGRKSMISWSDNRITLRVPLNASGTLVIQSMAGRLSEPMSIEIIDECIEYQKKNQRP